MRRRPRPAATPTKTVPGARLLRDRLTAEGPLRLYREGWGDFTILLLDAPGGRGRVLVESDDYAAALAHFARETRARGRPRAA